MSKPLRTPVPPPAQEVFDEDPRPDETMDEFSARRDEEESRWRGRHGGQGPTRHNQVESRHYKFFEDWDPYLGSL